jgi:hypothetical protein
MNDDDDDEENVENDSIIKNDSQNKVELAEAIVSKN